MEAKSDEQLLAEHIAGVKGAFDELVARYANELYGFLCRFVGDRTAADDLLQDTFMQLHLAANSFDQRRSLRPWLYTIAANKARDYMRSRGRRQQLSLEAGGENDRGSLSQMLETIEPPSSETVEREEQRQAVRRIVDRMPEHLRLILTLGYFQQLPYAEIAQVLDIPVGTVKSRLHAAVQHFGRLWREQDSSGSVASNGEGRQTHE